MTTRGHRTRGFLTINPIRSRTDTKGATTASSIDRRSSQDSSTRRLVGISPASGAATDTGRDRNESVAAATALAMDVIYARGDRWIRRFVLGHFALAIILAAT